MTNKMTLRQYLLTANKPLYEFEDRYLPIHDPNFQVVLCDYMRSSYGSLKMRSLYNDYVSIDDLRLQIAMQCEMLYDSHEYHFTKLWETLNLEYNPIENYRLSEEETDTRGSKTEIKATQGERNSAVKNEIGRISSNTDTIIGEQIIKDEKNIDEHDKQTDTVSVSAYDKSDFSPKEKSESITDRGGKDISAISNGKRDDKITSVTDSRIDSETSIMGKAIDETVRTNAGELSREMKRSGNIGVTTTQKMITDERKIARYSFIEEVARLLIAHICMRVYDNDEDWSE